MQNKYIYPVWRVGEKWSKTLTSSWLNMQTMPEDILLADINTHFYYKVDHLKFRPRFIFKIDS